ncbi:probable disease resistance protein At5g63020 isoform X1 [Zingiber officinale]|uniref:probable disease resistance protein At5g63020 isoform X1 n=1 Tax=Zingiber officinale TaxID=94328 RepID=UPI001C4D7587|nr:probable disease resistance protein At5g63020 isoform X1 [Zingiber officinale]
MGFLCKFWCSWTPMILFSAAPWDCAILRHQDIVGLPLCFIYGWSLQFLWLLPHPSGFLDSLAVEIHELKSKRDDIERDVSRARRVGKEPRSQVLWWLDRVELLETKFAKTRREFERRFMLPGGFAVNILSSYRLSVRANEMIAEACYLKSKGSFNQVANRAAPNHFEEVPSAPTVGMDAVLAQLKQAVEDDAVGLIGIYGMGGVGKTALLSRFHNEFLADATDLDMVIFIDSCRDLDVESIQNKIRHRLGLSWKKSKSQKEKASMLYKVLFKMKFVLILDDLWEPLSLQMVGIPIPKQGSSCKIMLATRIEELCDQMDVKNKIKVDLLPWDTAWRLFADKVGEETINSDPGIRHQAEILVKKCGGLPVALITVARALASKRSVDEWKHAVTIMGNSPVQLPGMVEQVFCSLKLSYDHLPSDTLRSCAMHFALYWEGCRLHKNLIQEYWIGEGILDDFKDVEQANNKACYFLGILSSASLIERVDADGYTRMHPMVRAMALWIACEFGKKENQWFVREREGLMEAPEAETWRGAARMALGYNSITVLPEAPESLNLVSLKLKSNFGLERIPDGFFRFMPCLVALDLHSTPIKEIPSGISNLQRLQFLELGGTKLKSLPKELASLKNLKYLGLNWTAELASIPERLIQSLSELRVLRMIVSYSSWKAIPAGGGNGVSLRELEALKRLRVLDITVGNAPAFNMLTQSQRLAPATAALLLKGCPGLTAVELPSGLGRSLKSLKWLRVSHSTELEEVLIAGDGRESDDAVLPELENLVLECLLKAKIVWRSSCIQHLRGLYIYGCSGMEQLIWYKDDDDSDAENRGRRGVSPFPNLKQIAFRGLPKLKRVSDERQLVFPLLESIEVAECPQLKKLNLVAEKLREIRCHRSWWDQLEWEDDAARFSPQMILKPLN